MFLVTTLSIMALAYLRNQKPLTPYATTPQNSIEPLGASTLYQYDPKRDHPAMFLTVSPSCPTTLSLDSEMGVQMVQVMVTPPTPVKRAVRVA